MASVFKRDNSKCWQISWFDHTGARRQKSARTTDYAAATRIANKLDAEAALKRDGVVDPRIDDIAKQAARGIRSI